MKKGLIQNRLKWFDNIKRMNKDWYTKNKCEGRMNLQGEKID